jgi:hypothetical protein
MKQYEASVAKKLLLSLFPFSVEAKGAVFHFYQNFIVKKSPSRQNDCLPPISAYGMMEENTIEGVIQNEKMASGRKRRLLSDLQ